MPVSDVKIVGLSKHFARSVRAIDELDLSVAEGELMVLLGPSGCGKTTLLRCLAGLEQPDGGEIHVGGRAVFAQGGRVNVPTHKRGLGMVFQNYALWPHLSVGQNVAYPLRARGVPRSERRERALDALSLVECADLVDRVPSAISGGQQQRVALARAVVAQPRLMLFDEPLSNLDYRLRGQLREQIRSLHRTLGFTGVYVTHDQTEAMQLGSQVAVLRHGRVEQLGRPEEIFSRPATAYVARFLGISNCLALERSDGGWLVAGHKNAGISTDVLTGESYELFVRSSDVLLELGDGSRTGLSLPGEVVDVVYAGETREWLIDVGGTVVRASARSGTWAFRPGDRVTVRLPAGALLAYERVDGSRLVTLPG